MFAQILISQIFFKIQFQKLIFENFDFRRNLFVGGAKALPGRQPVQVRFVLVRRLGVGQDDPAAAIPPEIVQPEAQIPLRLEDALRLQRVKLCAQANRESRAHILLRLDRQVNDVIVVTHTLQGRIELEDCYW